MTGIDDPYEPPLDARADARPRPPSPTRSPPCSPPSSASDSASARLSRLELSGERVGGAGWGRAHPQRGDGGRAGGAAHARVRGVLPHVRLDGPGAGHRPHGDRLGHARPRPQRGARRRVAVLRRARSSTPCWASLDDAGAEQAVVLGHSLGGYLSLELALAHPDRVRGVVLVDTGPGYRNDVARDGWNRMAAKLRQRPRDQGPRRAARRRRAGRRACTSTAAGLADRGPQRADPARRATSSTGCRRSPRRRSWSSATGTSRSSRARTTWPTRSRTRARRHPRRRPRPARHPSRRVQRRAAHVPGGLDP